MQKRLEIEFIGNVQGVGFRYTTENIARRYAVKGCVKNLANNNVEVIAEGEELTLKAFLDDIKGSLAQYISHEQATWMEAQGKFKGFRIAF